MEQSFSSPVNGEITSFLFYSISLLSFCPLSVALSLILMGGFLFFLWKLILVFKVIRKDLVMSYSLQVSFWGFSQGCHNLTREDFNSYLICLGIRRKSINFPFLLQNWKKKNLCFLGVVLIQIRMCFFIKCAAACLSEWWPTRQPVFYFFFRFSALGSHILQCICAITENTQGQWSL